MRLTGQGSQKNEDRGTSNLREKDVAEECLKPKLVAERGINSGVCINPVSKSNGERRLRITFSPETVVSVLADSAMRCVEEIGSRAVEICVGGGGLELLRRRFGDLTLSFRMEVAGYRLEGWLAQRYPVRL